MEELIVFVKSSYQRDLCLASIKCIKPFNGKVGLRDATKISGSCPMLDGEIPPSDFEISNNNDKIRKYRINIKLLNEYRITDKYKVIE